MINRMAYESFLVIVVPDRPLQLWVLTVGAFEPSKLHERLANYLDAEVAVVGHIVTGEALPQISHVPGCICVAS